MRGHENNNHMVFHPIPHKRKFFEKSSFRLMTNCVCHQSEISRVCGRLNEPPRRYFVTFMLQAMRKDFVDGKNVFGTQPR